MGSRWTTGQDIIRDLIDDDRLQPVPDDAAGADRMLADAKKNVLSAEKITDDTSGSFSLAYDGARKALTAALLKQGLRPLGGEGSHVLTGEAVSAQLGAAAAPIQAFNWMRNTRNRAQYMNQAPSVKDTTEGISHAKTIVEAMEDWLPHLNRFW